jgi:hypothetical protein
MLCRDYVTGMGNGFGVGECYGPVVGLVNARRFGELSCFRGTARKSYPVCTIWDFEAWNWPAPQGFRRAF